MYLFSTILDRFSHLKRRYRKLVSWSYKRFRNSEMDYWTCQSIWRIRNEPRKFFTRERNL